MSKIFLRFRKIMCIMLAFIAAVGTYTTTFVSAAAATKVTAGWEKSSTRPSYNKVATGVNTVRVKSADSSHANGKHRIIDFVAPKAGTYTFHFENLKSGAIDLPALSLAFETGMNGSKWFDFKEVETKLNGEKYSSYMLMSTKWAESVIMGEAADPLDQINAAIESGHVDYLDLTVKLKKNQVLRIKNYFVRDMNPNYHNWEESEGAVSYTLEIRRK